jgi:hypothetical protein
VRRIILSLVVAAIMAAVAVLGAGPSVALKVTEPPGQGGGGAGNSSAAHICPQNVPGDEDAHGECVSEAAHDLR